MGWRRVKIRGGGIWKSSRACGVCSSSSVFFSCVVVLHRGGFLAG